MLFQPANEKPETRLVTFHSSLITQHFPITCYLFNADAGSEVAGKHTGHVAFDLINGYGPSGIEQLLIGFAERRRDNATRMLPFVDQLFENARIRVLRDE